MGFFLLVFVLFFFIVYAFFGKLVWRSETVKTKLGHLFAPPLPPFHYTSDILFTSWRLVNFTSLSPLIPLHKGVSPQILRIVNVSSVGLTSVPRHCIRNDKVVTVRGGRGGAFTLIYPPAIRRTLTGRRWRRGYTQHQMKKQKRSLLSSRRFHLTSPKRNLQHRR